MEHKGRLVLLIVAVVSLVAAGAIGLALYFTKPKDIAHVAHTVPLVDCNPVGFPNSEPNKDTCEARGCIWSKPGTDEGPWCTYKEASSGYLLNGDPVDTQIGHQFTLKKIDSANLGFGDDVINLGVDVEFHNDHRLRIRFYDKDTARFEVPREALDIEEPSTKPESTLYDFQYTNEPHFGVKVKRKSTNATIFDTSDIPGFVFSDQYIQLTTRLASGHLYGLGEHNHRQFKHNMNWKKWTIFTRDVAPVDEWNLYGAQPMYMNLEEDGNANALLLKNSNAMDIILQPDPTPGVSFRTIGGVLDFYIFLGPSPENIVQQYTMAVGRAPMPPYWALGFQLSRWDYNNITRVKEVVERNIQAGIPLDVQYGDIDYMESKMDFTIDPVKYAGLKEFVDELHNKGMRYIIILDHIISNNETMHQEKLGKPYKALHDGLAEDVFIRNASGEYLQGEVWPGISYYPDFTLLENATRWWTEQCREFYEDQGIEYDALWIDMNEPSNFEPPGSTDGCQKNSLNYPPYLPNILGGHRDNMLYDKTICMDAQQNWGAHYDVHSLYGHSMSQVTYESMRTLFPKKRPLVLTRSQFAGSGKYASHWLGDNQSQWRQMPWSIPGMLEYGLFGFPYIGADICGFWFEATEEMCQRWMQLGAFYPFARNHNAQGWPSQDPAAFSENMIASSRNVLLTRYKLLPYLYTLFHYAHTEGSTVVRALLHEFPTDRKAWSIDRQFLWGAGFMISPVMEEGVTEIDVYFPNARWYNYYNGHEMMGVEKKHKLDTPLDSINLHVRGGHVIPYQEPANTTHFSRTKPFGLIVALNENNNASGSLFWDDGESFETFSSGNYTLIKYSVKLMKLSLTVEHNGYTGSTGLHYNTVVIFGLHGKPTYVLQDGNSIAGSQIQYDSQTKRLEIVELNLSLTDNHEIEWRFT